MFSHMAVCQNLVPLVNIKIAGKWMFIPLKMVLIGIDPYPYVMISHPSCQAQTRSKARRCEAIPGKAHAAFCHTRKATGHAACDRMCDNQ